MGTASYLRKRSGTANWWIRIVPPGGGKALEKSLYTSDKNQAIIAALPYIEAHKKAQIEARRHFVMEWAHAHAPGRLHIINGQQVMATDRELMHLDASGAVVKTEPNGGMGARLVGAGVVAVPPNTRMYNVIAAIEPRPKVVVKNGDDAILERYLAHGGKRRAGLNAKAAHSVESTWQLFRSLTGGKPLKECNRDDGRALVAALEAKGLKSATVQRQIKPLAALVNMAIDEGKFNGVNPFARVAPSRDDALERVPFSDTDIALIKSKLGELPESRSLLLRVLATTGMRLSEAFQIRGEATELSGPHLGRGVRYCVIGSKTSNSKRRVPFPAALLPNLPKEIKGPLFRGNPPIEGGALGRFIRSCGIKDPAKVIHSFRHRAKDRLRAAACPLDVQYELLGHEIETVAAGYGQGSPACLLKRWVDKIGF
jgi:integrase